MDITPNNISEVIDLSIQEESAIGEILAELQQRFPEQPVEMLRNCIARTIEDGARSGALGFYSRILPSQPHADVPAEEAVRSLSRPETWARGTYQLVVYEKGG